MPGIKLPSYDAPQVQEHSSPTPNVAVPIPNMSEGLVRAGGAAVNVMSELVARADQARIDEFKNKMETSDNQDILAYRAKEGKDALADVLPDGSSVDPIKARLDARKARVDKMLKDLTPSQQRHAKLVADAHDVRYESVISEHFVGANKVFQKSTADAAVQVKRDSIVIDSLDPAKTQVHMAELAEAVAKAAPGKDVSSIVAEAKSQAARIAILNAASSGAVIGPEFDHLKAYLRPEDATAVNAHTKESNLRNFGYASAKGFSGDLSDAEALNSYADAASGGNADKRDTVMHYLKDFALSHKNTVDTKSSKALGTLVTNIMQPGASDRVGLHST